MAEQIIIDTNIQRPPQHNVVISEQDKARTNYYLLKPTLYKIKHRIFIKEQVKLTKKATQIQQEGVNPQPGRLETKKKLRDFHDG